MVLAILLPLVVIVVPVLSVRVSSKLHALEQGSIYNLSFSVNCPYFFHFPFALKLCSKVQKISKHITKKVADKLISLFNNDREHYEKCWKDISTFIKFGCLKENDFYEKVEKILNETYSLLSSTITGQINSWLSKLTDVFTMGFNFRTDGEGETASQEYEANFQIHPINQLIINGNFGYRYNDLSNRPFFGDLDVEYLLTENGKLRVKAYTHTVDKYSLRQANMVQGVGFVFKHDFNWNKKKKQDEESPSTKRKQRTKKSRKVKSKDTD